jgi:hypothetical protein
MASYSKPLSKRYDGGSQANNLSAIEERPKILSVLIQAST